MSSQSRDLQELAQHLAGRQADEQQALSALRVAATLKLDLIISDIGLPQMDGYELVKRLRQMPHLRDVPAIALTVYAAQADVEAALAAGFEAHLAKPFDPPQLIAEIERLLDERGRN